jgi:hypothetical protein
MSVKSAAKTEPKTEAPNAVEVVIQIADIVLAHRGQKATLSAIARTTQRAAGLVAFADRDERTAAENAAAVEIARRSNLI